MLSGMVVCWSMLAGFDVEPAVVDGRVDLRAVSRGNARRFASLAGSFESTTAPTPRFLSLYAADMSRLHPEQKMTPEHAKESLSQKVVGSFRYKASGEKWLDVRRMSAAGRLLNHQVVADDRNSSCSIDRMPEPGDRHVAEVSLGRNVTQQFFADLPLFGLLGLCMGIRGETVGSELQKHAAVATALDGGAQVEYRWETEQSGRRVRHALMWSSKPPAPVSYATFLLRPGVAEPTTVQRWTAADARLIDGGDVAIPRTIVIEDFNEDGIASFRTEFRLTELKVNGPLVDADFRPAIENGSNVKDERTGKHYVYGRTLSPRIKKFIREEVEESRRPADPATRPTTTPSLSEPTIPWTWLLGIVGACLATTAGFMKWRSA